MLQVFESHAEVIGYDTFTLCSLPYLKQIVEKVKKKLGPDAVPMVMVLLYEATNIFKYFSITFHFFVLIFLINVNHKVVTFTTYKIEYFCFRAQTLTLYLFSCCRRFLLKVHTMQ